MKRLIHSKGGTIKDVAIKLNTDYKTAANAYYRSVNKVAQLYNNSNL